jgi:hypothetical protein
MMKLTTNRPHLLNPELDIRKASWRTASIEAQTGRCLSCGVLLGAFLEPCCGISASRGRLPPVSPSIARRGRAANTRQPFIVRPR